MHMLHVRAGKHTLWVAWGGQHVCFYRYSRKTTFCEKRLTRAMCMGMRAPTCTSHGAPGSQRPPAGTAARHQKWTRWFFFEELQVRSSDLSLAD